MAERVDREMEELGITTMRPTAYDPSEDVDTREPNRFGDTIAKYTSGPLQEAWTRVMDAGKIDVDPDDPALVTALKRANDYFGDMAMAGLDVAEAGAKAVAASVGEVFGDVGGQGRSGEERLTEDLIAMPEAFAGAGISRGANMLDDVLDTGGDAVRYIGRAAKDRANQPGEVPVMGTNLGNVGKTDAPFDADRGDGVKLPPPENAQRTQISGTFPTYEKAEELLSEVAPDGRTLDYGAGLGKSQELGFDTYEPFPREGFNPTFSSAGDIPDNSYEKITNLNVLNVVPKDARDEIVTDIGRVLKPGGKAVITTRGRDVMSATGQPGPESMSVITGRGTYQKGFTQKELREYVQSTLGDDFEVENVGLGPAGVVVKKRGPAAGDADLDTQTVLGLRAEEMSLKPKDRTQPSRSEPLFDLSPESYERTLPDQKETYVPRQPAGSNNPLPKFDRGRPVQEMSDKIADRLAERMEPWLGTEAQYFYHTGPIIDKARDLGFSDEEIFGWMREFADAYASTSPRTETAQNIRNATLAMAKRQLNVDLSDVVGPGGDGINEKGYPMMIGRKGDLDDKGKPLKSDGIHRRLLTQTQEGDIDPDTNPKPATFAENVYGNLDGVTADTHAIRGALDAMNEIAPGSIPEGYIKPKFREQYKADPSSLKPATMIDDTLGSQKIDGKDMQTEYAVFSDIYRKAAERLGVSPAEAQSMGWFGSGDSTGLASELKSVARLLDERIDVTAQATGTNKETIFRKLLNREIPVMSIMPAAPAAGLMASEDEDTGNFARGGLALSESHKGIKTQAGMDMADNKKQLDRKKADVDGDGELSDYEKQRGEAIQNAEMDGELVPDMACGGIMGDPMMTGMDPVSGNEIPVGATAENVRDDIPVNISQDEYVLPAHVVKYHGLKYIMDLQSEAEMGLMTMKMDGLIQTIGDEDEGSEEEPDGEGSEAAEVSEEGRDAEEGDGSEETLETPEGNEIEVAGVETTTTEFEDDETEEYEESAYPTKTKSTMYGMMKKPKVTFIV
jgi:SAM-dependent methyltransferase